MSFASFEIKPISFKEAKINICNIEINETIGEDIEIFEKYEKSRFFGIFYNNVECKNKNGEKVNRIFIYSGDKFTCPDEVQAGTVCAVTGLTFTRCGDCLGAQKNTLPPVLQPVLSYSLILPENVNVHTALEKLRCLEQEDFAFRRLIGGRSPFCVFYIKNYRSAYALL